MKQFVVLCLILCGPALVVSQPIKIWNKIFGGNQGDYCNEMGIYEDSLIVAVGKSNSPNLVNKGLDDAAICVFTPGGVLRHIKTFGSSSNDFLNSFAYVPGGNLITVGTINGKGGDIANIHGLLDGWIMAYDPKKNVKLWEKNFGGTNNDQLNDVYFLETGKVIFAGASKSTDRDMTGNKGGFDVLVGTMDEAGNLVRSRNLGGSKDEFARKILHADGANFFIFGETSSNNEGDFTGLTNKGAKDVFGVKLNRNSNQILSLIFGGPGDDLFADAVSFEDGSAILFINTSMKGGDIDSIKGGKDIFMVKIKNDGKILWKKPLGGTKDDEAVKAILDKDNNILLLCTSFSNDGDLNGNYGDKDVALMKLDTSGNVLWATHYGGTKGETASSMASDNMGNTYFTATSFSTNNDLPVTNTVPPDFWTLRLYECPLILTNYTKEACIGDTLTINGKAYFQGNSFGSDTMKGKSYLGCDSLINVLVNFNAASTENYTDTLCNESTSTINGVFFDKNKTSHTFDLTNQYGCDSTLLVNLYFTQPLTLKDSTIVNDNGTTNGSIRIVVQGGTAPYAYNWSNGFKSSQIVNLKAGTYSVTVTDARSCIQTFSFTIKSTVAADDLKASLVSYSMDDAAIKFSSEEKVESVEVFTLNGQSIWSQSVRSQQFSLRRNQLPKGLILVQLQLGSGKVTSLKMIN